eukprot:1178326-Prorocentrum_minimum.AAC.1
MSEYSFGSVLWGVESTLTVIGTGGPNIPGIFREYSDPSAESRTQLRVSNLSTRAEVDVIDIGVDVIDIGVDVKGIVVDVIGIGVDVMNIRRIPHPRNTGRHPRTW